MTTYTRGSHGIILLGPHDHTLHSSASNLCLSISPKSLCMTVNNADTRVSTLLNVNIVIVNTSERQLLTQVAYTLHNIIKKIFRHFRSQNLGNLPTCSPAPSVNAD